MLFKEYLKVCEDAEVQKIVVGDLDGELLSELVAAMRKFHLEW